MVGVYHWFEWPRVIRKQELWQRKREARKREGKFSQNPNAPSGAFGFLVYLQSLMRYQIRYTKIDSSASLKSYIEEKLVNTLEKLARTEGPHDPWQIMIEVGKETTHHQKGNVWFAEVSGVTSYGGVRVRSEASEIHEAVDLAEEELKSKLSRLKGRIFAKGLRAARRVKNMIRLSRFARFFRKGRIRDGGL